MNKKNNNNYYFYVHLEVLVWLVIFLFILLTCFIFYHNSQKQYEIHKIFLSDVDGLIAGSPVRLMGVQVGYVNKIKIVGDSVYLKFIIKDKGLHLPWGTKATVEFSGMAGSRSLELYPPDRITDGENVNYIEVINPTRLSQSLSLLYDMYNKFTDIYISISAFSGNINLINSEAERGSENLQFANFLEFVNFWLDNSNSKISELRNKIWKEK